MTTTTHDNACLVCGSAGGHTTEGVLRRCGACAFTWTVQSSRDSKDLYDASYFRGSEGYEDYFVPGPRRFEAARRLRWLTATARPTSLIEAGCAGGFFVAAARDAGIAAQGVEISDTAVGYGRDKLGVRVTQGAFESIVFAEPVDAVCAFHVLEHVDDPHQFLTAARRAVKPGGWLALEVPNVASAGARRLRSAWPGLQPRYHRWHFSPATLIRLLTAHGFELMCQDTAAFRYYMPSGYRFRHAHRLLARDVLGMRSPRLTHPRHGDLLRLIARRPASDREAAR